MKELYYLISGKTWVLLSGLLLSSLSIACQVDSTWKSQLILEDVARFAVDPLQQILTVGDDGVLVLHNPQGQALFRYHNTTLGEDFTIDATDPFNILLFYEDQQTVILLDRTLSERASLDLRDTEILYATAVARSHDNNLWVYDELAGRLYRLSARGDILFTSNDFRLSENLSIGPTSIIRQGDRVVLNFPDRGLALFSALGQLLEWWPIRDATHLFFHRDQLYYQQAGEDFKYHPRQGVIQQIAWPQALKPTAFFFQLNRRYLLSADHRLHIQLVDQQPAERN